MLKIMRIICDTETIMTIEHAKAFLQDLARNEALKLRFLSCPSATNV